MRHRQILEKPEVVVHSSDQQNYTIYSNKASVAESASLPNLEIPGPYGNRIVEQYEYVARFLQLAATDVGQAVSYQREFKDTNGIKNVPYFSQEEFLRDNVHLRADRYAFFFAQELGDKLSAIAETMGSGDSQYLLIIGECLYLAITITVNAGNEVVLKVYDGEHRYAHREILCNNAQVLKTINITQFMDINTIDKSYFSHGIIATYDNPLRLKKTIVNEIEIPERYTHHHVVLLAYGLYFNAPKVVQASLPTLITAFLTNGIFVNITTLLGLRGPTPGLFFAAESGATECALAYGDIVLNSNLSAGACRLLLLGMSPRVTPALYMAHQWNRAKFIQAFCAMIQKTDRLPEEFKQGIVVAKRVRDQASGFSTACQMGHVETVATDLAIMNQMGWKDSDKSVLLEGRTVERNNQLGLSCLGISLANGHNEVVKLLVITILHLDISVEEKVRLLKAEYKGKPSVGYAYYYKHLSTIACFKDLIVDSDLPDEHKKALLAPLKQMVLTPRSRDQIKRFFDTPKADPTVGDSQPALTTSTQPG